MPDPEPAHGQRRKQARPRELLDAARALFVEKGFTAARAQDIAARAGVSKATLYLYFRSKEELLQALIAERFRSGIVIGDAHGHAGDGRPSRALLRDALLAWRTGLLAADAGGLFKLVVTETRNFPGLAQFWSREVLEPAHSLVAAIVERGVKRGEFRAVDPTLVVHALVLPVLVSCLHRHAMRPALRDEALTAEPDLFGRLVDLVLEGLAAPPSLP
jgi:AcrR family transcriptional regulator